MKSRTVCVLAGAWFAALLCSMPLLISGCSGFGAASPPANWTAPGMTVRPHDAELDADEIEKMLQSREERIATLLQQQSAQWRESETMLSARVDGQIKEAVSKAGEIAAKETTEKLNSRLEQWFADAGVDSIELQTKIRDAVSTEVASTVQQEVELAAAKEADALRATLDVDREMAIKAASEAATAQAKEIAADEAAQLRSDVEATIEKNVISQVGAALQKYAPAANVVPGYGTAIATIMGLVGSALTAWGAWWYRGKKADEQMFADERAKRVVPPKA